MNSQRADYDLAFNELQHAVSEHGPGPDLDAVLGAIEDRLIGRYPEDEHAIHELIASWLVTLRVQTSLQGFI